MISQQTALRCPEISFYGCEYGNAIDILGTTGVWVHHCVCGWSPSHFNNIGIYVRGDAMHTLNENNTCNYNENGGVYVHGSDYSVIRYNTCNYNTSAIYESSFGICLYATTFTATHGNTLCYNDYGMYYSYNSVYEVFSGNTCGPQSLRDAHVPTGSSEHLRQQLQLQQ